MYNVNSIIIYDVVASICQVFRMGCVLWARIIQFRWHFPLINISFGHDWFDFFFQFTMSILIDVGIFCVACLLHASKIYSEFTFDRDVAMHVLEIKSCRDYLDFPGDWCALVSVVVVFRLVCHFCFENRSVN